MDKQTFLQNYQLAQDGGDAAEAAIDCLFKQFNFQFGIDDPEEFFAKHAVAEGGEL
ncbi:hypothetical protein [Tichowtungia aerotolerans]|uniref:Uncharacterized protein n=1 Tax=Tichowtungia aerotolerans TaxID=2697043 RepID=A0A6P1M7C7_9BACT|nr:hypothetical protein [Tichowtungia aerotolerans]QHI70490.1 hypothetical protein GT409_13925 [Tichowtungia aerotolerans]